MVGVTDSLAGVYGGWTNAWMKQCKQRGAVGHGFTQAEPVRARVSYLRSVTVSESYWHNSYLSSLWGSRHGCHHPASIAESGTVMNSEYVTVVVSSNPTKLKMR